MALFDWFAGKKKAENEFNNAFNKSFYQFMGGRPAQYDYDRKTYVEKGFGLNPDVYAVIMQQADKLNAIPYYVKQIDDNESARQLKQLANTTKGEYSIKQLQRKYKLEKKAYKEEYKPFPLQDPNPNQTWAEIWALTKVFEQTCGEYYLYKAAPKDGINKGQPTQVYILPSYLMKIVLVDKADVLQGENIISHYMLIEGNQFIEFLAEDIIHVKLPNPFFDFSGGHLYGLSPLKVALRNVESSNDAIDHNVKTMKNGGVFGFIHGTDASMPMTPQQAVQIKEKMLEMDKDPGRLSKIAAASVPMAFTKMSLDTDQLKPFDYLSYDQKIICNILGWSTQLLNSDDGSKYGEFLKTVQRNVVINHTVPRLNLLMEALNKHFIPLFRGYENSEVVWDWMELPEMQTDMKSLIDAYKEAPITKNEFRELINYERLEDVEGMDVVWVNNGTRRIDEMGISEEELNKAFNQ